MYDSTKSTQDVLGNLLVINADPNQKYTLVADAPEPKPRPIRREPFMMVLGGPYMRSNRKSVWELIQEMTFDEKWFFLHVLINISFTTNISFVDNATLTRTEVNKKVRAFKTLKEKNILKRVSREHYMVNPRVIQLTDKFQVSCEAQWDSLV